MMYDLLMQEGEAKDYQIWVLSGKEDSPYPLIGKYIIIIWVLSDKEDLLSPVRDKYIIIIWVLSGKEDPLSPVRDKYIQVNDQLVMAADITIHFVDVINS